MMWTPLSSAEILVRDVGITCRLTLAAVERSLVTTLDRVRLPDVEPNTMCTDLAVLPLETPPLLNQLLNFLSGAACFCFFESERDSRELVVQQIQESVQRYRSMVAIPECERT